ncbi:MAG: phosphate ABC transporter substrate-binding protein PstS [Rhodocyclaceae bacterium]|jgi:phosphate transport system substrate-binding protein|nr:phosphate ABC transporter substrate-binding protein PstS [Rhodocyclaceae bacterium]MCA3074113.1 phosphate ABC transporter substrate-binding protein PstS [Rhodocyclaceae bacterium]MCA3090957.1 phosphate ABC transporter substrate-binding protein PstS [Rhodocyclaceae bacterium]MCA3095007.1 phosphate ABC transporter substrate-binding protein PstS [Rhodocyclaceae bacterium]MCA3099350.1 phosphate ABC transporter substrate-binding protein PstS [Rhodocyclaceae bacterium]
MKLSRLLAAATATLTFVAASAAIAQVTEITGAGATFPAPLYARWAADYNKATGVRMNYQSIGSGGGLRQIRGKTVFFGASDVPLTDEELAKDGLFQFPTVIGGVVPIINIAGLQARQLRLTGEILADIYLGKITRWNDPVIVKLNPGVKLPDAQIAPVRRADGSGTTFIFTNYLSKVSAEWQSKVGEGASVNWPTGAGGKGNEGVTAFVQRLPNSIGYVEYSYARQNKLPYALMGNAAGNFVAPDDLTFAAAAAGADWSKSFYQILTNQRGKDAWPITGATFIMMHRVQERPENATAVVRFFDWAYENGSKTALELDYVPMPPSVVKSVRALWSEMRDTNGKPVPTK